MTFRNPFSYILNHVLGAQNTTTTTQTISVLVSVHGVMGQEVKVMFDMFVALHASSDQGFRDSRV